MANLSKDKRSIFENVIRFLAMGQSTRAISIGFLNGLG